MNKLFALAIIVSVITSVSLNAAVYKGQKVYVKKCRKCHGGGQSVAASKTMRSWKKLLKKKGAGLSNMHLSNEKAKSSWKYFKSKKYKKRAKHLKDFMVEYAKDSGNVPACN